VNTFGVSAPGDKAYEHFGFTASNLTARATDVIAFYTKHGTALSCCFALRLCIGRCGVAFRVVMLRRSLCNAMNFVSC
jgi:hypothetical protein